MDFNIASQGEQLMLVLFGFAKQSALFEDMAGGVDTPMGSIVAAASLIGMALLVLNRKNWAFKTIASWVLLMIIIVAAPWDETAFFKRISSDTVTGANLPLSPFDDRTIEEQAANPPSEKSRESLIKFGFDIDFGKATATNILKERGVPTIEDGFLAFSPQLYTLSFMTSARNAIAAALMKNRSQSLVGDVGIINQLNYLQTNDTRPQHRLREFAAACGDKHPEALGRVGQNIPRSSSLGVALSGSYLTFGDVLDMHNLYHAQYRKDPSVAVLPPLANILTSVPSGLSPEGRKAFDAGLERTKMQLFTGLDTRLRPLYYDGGLWEQSTQKKRRPIEEWKRITSPENTRPLTLNLGEQYVGYLREIPAEITFPVVVAAAEMSNAQDWFGVGAYKSEVQSADGGAITVTTAKTCYELFNLVNADFQRAAANMTRLETLIQELAQSDQLANNMTPQEKALLAVKILQERGDVDEAFLVKNYLTASLARSSDAFAEVLAKQGMTPTSFNGAAANVSKEAGEITAPITRWIQSIFVGFGAGSFSAMFPYALGMLISLTLVATPVFLLAGLALPQYSFNALFGTVAVVAYLKFVEITYIMVNALFGAFKDLYTVQGMTSSVSASVHDLILGTAYGGIFLIALALPAFLRNPASAIEQIGKQSDKVTTVSYADTKQIATAVVGAALAVKTGGASLVAAGKGALNTGSDVADLAGAWRGSAQQGATFDAAEYQKNLDEKRAARAKAPSKPIVQGMTDEYLKSRQAAFAERKASMAYGSNAAHNTSLHQSWAEKAKALYEATRPYLAGERYRAQRARIVPESYEQDSFREKRREAEERIDKMRDKVRGEDE